MFNYVYRNPGTYLGNIPAQRASDIPDLLWKTAASNVSTQTNDCGFSYLEGKRANPRIKPPPARNCLKIVKNTIKRGEND